MAHSMTKTIDTIPFGDVCELKLHKRLEPFEKPEEKLNLRPTAETEEDRLTIIVVSVLPPGDPKPLLPRRKWLWLPIACKVVLIVISVLVGVVLSTLPESLAPPLRLTHSPYMAPNIVPTSRPTPFPAARRTPGSTPFPTRTPTPKPSPRPTYIPTAFPTFADDASSTSNRESIVAEITLGQDAFIDFRPEGASKFLYWAALRWEIP
jgi:hypothetical protein